MQIITIASAAALVATVAAAPSPSTTSFNLNSTCIESDPKVRVYNRCPYDVYLWSVLTGQGCPSGDGAVIKTGEFYQENYRPAVGEVGTSIKLSSQEVCDADKLLQLEYYIETNKPGYNYNYLDVSYVNCAETKSCPTASEGFYLKSGNENGKFLANTLNNICPILSCNDWSECSEVAYVNWDDVQTKSCDPTADLEFYMCGGDAPSSSDDTPVLASSAAASSTKTAAASKSTHKSTHKSSHKSTHKSTHTSTEEVPEPTSTAAASSEAASSAVEYKIAAAAITSAAVAISSQPIHIKTEVVYVTEVAYVNGKRHAHGHNHRQFHA